MSFVARNHPQQTAARGPVHDVDDRRTTDDTFDECLTLAGVDGFDLDPAANDQSARAPVWFTIATDGLTRDWFGRVWLNPPYSDLPAWVGKAVGELDAGRVSTLVMLLPANRTEQRWWQTLLEPRLRAGVGRVFFLAGRRRFDRPGWVKPVKGDRPPFGLVLVVLVPPRSP